MDDERFPDWAKDSYEACAHWEGTFQRETINSNRHPGEPLHIVITGSAEGWILINGDLEWHILELSLEYEGKYFEWISDWDEPQEAN